MNDLVTHDQAPAPKANLTSGGTLAALVPQTLDDAFRLSKALSLSGDMVPKHFQGKPEMIMAAVLRGAEIGLAPMQALSNIAVINGRASIWGDALPALLQRAGHEIDSGIDGEGDQMEAWAVVKRGDNGKETRRTFSVQDAKKAGLWGKQGPWQSYPQRMLQMRARAFAARDGAADALMGLQVAEEMRDAPPMRDVTPAAQTGPNLAQRLAAVGKAPNDIIEQTPMKEAAGDSYTYEAKSDPSPAPPIDTDLSPAHWTDAEPDDHFPGTPAFNEGVNAAKDGIPARECPYDQGTEQANDWLAAWHGYQKAQS